MSRVLKTEIDQKLMPPIEVVSDFHRQTLINGEKINFKKGDKVKLTVTHIFQKKNEHYYSLLLQINGAKLRIDRTVVHTVDLVAEVMQLREYVDEKKCCESPKPYCAVRHESGERLYKCKNCNRYLS